MLRVRPEELGLTAEQLLEQVKTHLDTGEKLKSYRGQSLVMHALHDSLVDVEHGETIFNHCPEPRRLKIFNRGDHNDIFSVNAGEYIEELRNFLGAF